MDIHLSNNNIRILKVMSQLLSTNPECKGLSMKEKNSIEISIILRRTKWLLEQLKDLNIIQPICSLWGINLSSPRRAAAEIANPSSTRRIRVSFPNNSWSLHTLPVIWNLPMESINSNRARMKVSAVVRVHPTLMKLLRDITRPRMLSNIIRIIYMILAREVSKSLTINLVYLVVSIMEYLNIIKP